MNRTVIIILVLTGLLVLLKLFNPILVDYFPPCPFRTLTGYSCPGCGAQRTLHHLLNFEFAAAFRANALLVISIPYLVTGLVFDMIKYPGKKILQWRQILFGRRTIYLVLVVIIGFWIARNLFFW